MLNEKIEAFLLEFKDYIGITYLDSRGISLDDKTKFSDLSFDIVDEVITEELIVMHFGLEEFELDIWPETIGDLLLIVKTRLPV